MTRASLFLALFLIATPASAEVGLPRAACAEYDPGAQIATLSDPEIDEASGLAASWRNEGIFWVHNDSGDTPRVFAIDLNGETQSVLTLNAGAQDWEDIAVGPCAPGDATPCVWVGDIGDNDEVRTNVTLYRFEEPDLGATPPAMLDISDVTAIDVTYEGGPRNAETLLVHPVEGDVYIVDKTVGDPTNLWRVPTDGTPASLIASTAFGEVGIVSGRVTGGDFSPSGDEFTLRTYHQLYTFCGSSVVEAFEGPRTNVIGTRLFQSEAVTYTRDGQTILTTTEVQQDEEPALLQMRRTDRPPEPRADVGSSDPPPGGTPDAGPTPRPNHGADVQVTLVDDYQKSSCSCHVARGEFGASALALVMFGAFTRRRRFRRRKRGGVN